MDLFQVGAEGAEPAAEWQVDVQVERLQWRGERFLRPCEGEGRMPPWKQGPQYRRKRRLHSLQYGRLFTRSWSNRVARFSRLSLEPSVK